MDACIFMMTINALTVVYGVDLATPVDQLGVNDKVCVTKIEHGWTEVHFSRGNTGHTGYLRDMKVQQNAQPSEPVARDEPYQIPDTPPAHEQENHSQYRGPQAPNQDMIVRPAALVMQCHPVNSTPYAVVYVNGSAAIIGGKTAHTTKYNVEEVKDNPSNHIFYVKADRPDQERTLFFAFDYSQRGNDVSAIRVMSNGYDAKDKCFMDWQDTK